MVGRHKINHPKDKTMQIKDGVIMPGLKLPMRQAIQAAESIYKSHDRPEGVTITSALDGTHTAGSYHYYGYAIDIRTHYFTSEQISTVVIQLRDALPDPYTIIRHKSHIHIHYSPTY